MKPEQDLALTKQSAMKTLHAALGLLIKNNGEMQRKELVDQLTNSVKFEPWETERYQSNGQLKWLTIFLFYSINFIKAGWLIKNRRTWYITPDGRAAYELGPQKMILESGKKYREWKSRENDKQGVEAEEEDLNITDTQVREATIDELIAQAKDSIGAYLEAIDDQKFQQLCEALLRVMGFYVDFNSPPGKDGGVDIIAFKDPLGFEKPRIKVQAKKYKESIKVDVKPIRELKGLLHRDEHIGIFITSSYFTRDAEAFARQSDIHIKLINRDELIELWQEYYEKLTEDEKLLLPLRPIYFLGG
jgi:restriction system protein